MGSAPSRTKVVQLAAANPKLIDIASLNSVEDNHSNAESFKGDTDCLPGQIFEVDRARAIDAIALAEGTSQPAWEFPNNGVEICDKLESVATMEGAESHPLYVRSEQDLKSESLLKSSSTEPDSLCYTMKEPTDSLEENPSVTCVNNSSPSTTQVESCLKLVPLLLLPSLKRNQMKDPQIERIYTLTMEVEDLKRVAEEQRVKYERRIQKLRNKLKVVRAESSLQIYGLQEEIKVLSHTPLPAIAPTVSTSTEEFLEELLQKKNQVIKDLSIQVLELNDRLLNPQGQ